MSNKQTLRVGVGGPVGVRQGGEGGDRSEALRTMHTELSSSVGAMRALIRDEFAREISRGQGLGHYRDDADPAAIGKQVAMMVFGWVMTAPVFNQDTSDPREWAESLAGMLGRALTW